MCLAETISAADGLVLTMLAMMALSFGTVALLAFCGLRNAARRNPHVDELIEEVTATKLEAPTTPVSTEPAVKLEPWEREGDWWKSS